MFLYASVRISNISIRKTSTLKSDGIIIVTYRGIIIEGGMYMPFISYILKSFYPTSVKRTSLDFI